MKKILKIVVLVVIFSGTVFLLIAANQKVNQQSMKSPVIDLTVQDGISLLTEKELLNELYTLRLFRFFFSSRRRHTRWTGDWSSGVCSSDLARPRRDRTTGAGRDCRRKHQVADGRHRLSVGGAWRQALHRGRRSGEGRRHSADRRSDEGDEPEIGRASCRERRDSTERESTGE